MRTPISPFSGFVGAALAIVLSLTGCSLLADTDKSPSPPAHIAAIESFAVYFANPWRDTLTTFDLVVLDPDNRSAAEIQTLREHDALPIAYINLGEAETYRYFYDQVDPDWLLGPNPNWPNHYYVDARAEGWHRLLLNTVLPDIMAKGFEGLFFDMVDTALPGLHPETRPGMIALIEKIRAAYPERTLIMNNGLFLVEDVHNSLDAQIVENVFTRYDFENDRYIRTDSTRRNDLVGQLHKNRAEYGLRPFLINYADATDRPLRTYASRAARKHGFLTFLSTVELDTVFTALPPQ